MTLDEQDLIADVVRAIGALNASPVARDIFVLRMAEAVCMQRNRFMYPVHGVDFDNEIAKAILAAMEKAND
jgi:hypothetical protein